MTRFISDQNKVALLMESGTYSNTSGNGYWPGQVMSHDVDENENFLETRYLGTANRNWSVMEQGPRDYTGTLNYRVQDFRLLAFALGSVGVVSGTNTTYFITEINNDARQSPWVSGLLNAPVSFTLEDSKVASGTGKNFIRTLRGCVPTTVTLTATQNEPVTCELGYVAQLCDYSSGNPTSITATTNRPYLWADTTITIGGSVVQTAKEVVLEVDQGTQGPHYLNGSKVIAAPFKENRNYTLTVTLDAESESIKPFYDQFFLGGSSLNITLDFNADNKAGVVGSQHAILIFSGCRFFDVTTPSPNEGVNEQTLVIRPQSFAATIYDRIGSPIGPF